MLTNPPTRQPALPLVTFVSVSQIHVNLPWVILCVLIDSFLNVKALLGAFNKEKVLVWAFSMIVKSSQTFV